MPRRKETQMKTPTKSEVLAYVNDTYTGMTAEEVANCVTFCEESLEDVGRDWATQLDDYVAAVERQRRAVILKVPAGSQRSNGGVQCDVDRGPCACGAWHDGSA